MLPVTFSVVSLLLLVQFTAASFGFHNNLLDDTSECPADSDERWSYRGNNGPIYWGEIASTCYGEQQSPIDIDSSTAELDMDLADLVMTNYNTPVTNARIVNNGHTVQMYTEDGVERCIIIEGIKYCLKQLHFHWGDNYERGTEHTIDGQHLALEMHLVHLNENNEIAVLGVMYEEVDDTNEDLHNIVCALSRLRYKDTNTQVSSVNLDKLLPENKSAFFRYKGSLTTPNCSEGVTWSVLATLNTVGSSQMDEFRKIYSTTPDKAEDACTLSNNFRPVQPLNDRRVTMRH